MVFAFRSLFQGTSASPGLAFSPSISVVNWRRLLLAPERFVTSIVLNQLWKLYPGQFSVRCVLLTMVADQLPIYSNRMLVPFCLVQLRTTVEIA